MKVVRFILLSGLLLMLGGCLSSQPERALPLGDPEMPYPPERPPQVGDILHNSTGFFISEQAMLDMAADARIIYIGETHDNPASHRVQLRVLEELSSRFPEKISLGMEMFTSAQQAVLDRWTAGELSERDFLKESAWYETWRMDFDYYRDILVLARDLNIPVIGLNAPRTLVGQISRSPIENLPDDIRSELPEFGAPDPYHTALIKAIFSGHKAGQGDIDGFLRVQTLWDEIMAENIANHLKLSENTQHRMVVLAGGNHISYGFGIPRRAFRRLPLSYLLIGTKEIEIPPDKQDRLMDVQKPAFPMRPYDLTVFTAYEDLGKQEVKLGIMLEAHERGVAVGGIIPDSAAQRAGLQQGDVLLQMDGELLEDSFDLIYLVKQKRPGDRSTLRIERAGEQMEFAVEFFLPGEKAGDE